MTDATDAKRCKPRAFIFDLDGTVLDTMPDLVTITNATLAELGLPQHTFEEIRSYIGKGSRVLMKSAMPASTTDEAIDEAVELWKKLYPRYGFDRTAPFPHMPEALAQLKAAGMKLGVLSNKFDAAAKSVVVHYYPDVFDIVRGESPSTPRKPNPQGLRTMMQDFGVSPDETLYFGDSAGDMEVANAAGVRAVGVAWGYRPARQLEEAGAFAVLSDPSEIPHCLTW